MYKNILVPVSLSADRNTKAAIEAAEILADDDATITVMHVVEDLPNYARQYLSEEFMSEARAKVEAELANIAAEHPKTTPEVVSGHSGRTILDQLKARGCDCVIIASHKPAFEDHLFGSTAAQVVRHAPCSVHVIR